MVQTFPSGETARLAEVLLKVSVGTKILWTTMSTRI
jgi:hypothetical protein